MDANGSWRATNFPVQAGNMRDGKLGIMYDTPPAWKKMYITPAWERMWWIGAPVLLLM